MRHRDERFVDRGKHEAKDDALYDKRSRLIRDKGDRSSCSSWQGSGSATTTR